MPHNMNLIDTIEKVQRNFIMKLPGLCDMTYLQRLNICKIESLEECRFKIDLTWMYKILHNLICINLGNNIKLTVNNNTIGKDLSIPRFREKSRNPIPAAES